MRRIRKVQLQIESLYHLDEMKTPVHLCIGQEAVAVGVCANLLKEDYVSSNHRGHGHYLAKGGDLKAMIAELYCKESGCSKGRGGSMHLVDSSAGLMGSSSIVGGGIPIATGLGLAIQMRQQDRVSVVFLGDGAIDEGCLYESVNFAILKHLPVVYVYENNHFSVCSHVSSRHYGDVIFHHVPPEHLFSQKIDGNSVLEVYEAARQAVERARSGKGPAFMECDTYRIRGHAGAGDSPHGYRSREAVLRWEARCPIRMCRDRIVKEGFIDEQGLSEMEKRIDEEIDEAFAFAQGSELPRAQDLHRYLYHG
jgi:pyruvate dehydrogenase E1 component alpha subunit